jgi:hypothetical protein
VKRYFEPHGLLLSVSLFQKEGRSKCHAGLGCAYVNFARKSEAEETIRALSKSVRSVCIFIQLGRAPCNSDGRMESKSASG